MHRKFTKSEISLLKKSGYSEKAIEYYENRVNFGIIINPDVAFDYTGPCGDSMRFYLKIDTNGLIKDVKFQYLGCPGAASSGSALAKIAKSKNINEAKMISEDDVISELGGLPESKLDCAKLAIEAFRKTILKYENNPSNKKRK